MTAKKNESFPVPEYADRARREILLVSPARREADVEAGIRREKEQWSGDFWRGTDSADKSRTASLTIHPVQYE